ncbi:hypothetical protein B0H14DRAFT_3650630 [Mycena olivaceomarginata]|nr:hypothetical protein B0H14DRAFT_3650630 [Mycena olivaceomarginata]
MINATNVAIVGINGVEPFTEADLAEQLALRGQRSKAKATDILPTPEDDKIVGKSFVALIAEMIVAFTPGNSGWKDRKDIAEAVAAMMPEDRPLPPDKSDLRPFGLLDTNEGSKKGVVKVLGGIQERSTLSQIIWASIWRIFVGDWLTSNNLRAARRDRTDDINPMESRLWSRRCSVASSTKSALQNISSQRLLKNLRRLHRKKPPPVEAPRSAIIDVFVKGAEEWNGKFTDIIKSTTYNPALGGYPPAASSDSGPRNNTLDTGTVFDNPTNNPLTFNGFMDLHTSEDHGEITGTGALGGGGDFDGVE